MVGVMDIERPNERGWLNQMRYERTQKALQELHGVELSQGAINRIMERAGRAADEALAPIKKAICHSAVVNSDETGVRVAGRTWWQWVFCTATAVLHLIKPSRSAAVIEAVLTDIHRKVTNGFRSQWGAEAYAALAFVIDTAKLQRRSPFESIQQLFSPPALPIPAHTSCM